MKRALSVPAANDRRPFPPARSRNRINAATAATVQERRGIVPLCLWCFCLPGRRRPSHPSFSGTYQNSRTSECLASPCQPRSKVRLRGGRGRRDGWPVAGAASVSRCSAPTRGLFSPGENTPKRKREPIPREHTPFEDRGVSKLFRRSEDPPVNSASLARYRPIVLPRWQYFDELYTFIPSPFRLEQRGRAEHGIDLLLWIAAPSANLASIRALDSSRDSTGLAHPTKSCN